jgi:hypothetical protein
MKNLKFVKENNQWYIDLPEWEGSKAELEMVAGADVLLDHIANEKTNVSILVSEDDPDNNAIILSKTQDLENGANYKVGNCSAVDKLWLCDVTKYVYGYMPKNLFVYFNN